MLHAIMQYVPTYHMRQGSCKVLGVERPLKWCFMFNSFLFVTIKISYDKIIGFQVVAVNVHYLPTL